MGIITTKDLNLYYGDKQAINSINMDIEKNKITALIGPSGCGKTTFLKTLNRMNDTIPNCKITGEVIYDGINIYDSKRWSEFKLYSRFGNIDIHSDILSLMDGTILVAISGGLFSYKENQWQKYVKPDLPLPKNRWYLYETSDRNLWIIGLSSNVWRMDLSKNKWITFQGIHFQAEDINGDKWFLF